MDPRQIFIFSDIDEYTAQFVIQQLLSLDRQNNQPITMVINSPGGYVSCMFAIIDTMNAVVSPIRTVVMGMAASAAACIAACGDERLITENAQFMLHEANAMNWGDISTMQDQMQQNIAQNEKMFRLLSTATGQVMDTLKSITLKTDKYFSAQEAVQFGLADKVIGNSEAQALKLSEDIHVEGQLINVEGKEVQLLRTGKFNHPIYGEVLISDANLGTMKKNFENKVRGIDISIDYTHDNDSGEKPAAFWIKALEIRENKDGKGKGLFARGEFTPGGLKKISEKEYKYSSADFVVDYVNEQGQHFPYVLRGGSLTNKPFIKGMDAIKLSEYEPVKKEIKSMNKEQLMAALKEFGVDVAALQTDSTGLKTKVAELENKIKELSALPAQKESEIASLKTELAKANQKIVDEAKEGAFDGLVRAGKVVPAQKESILKTFNCAEDIAAFYKDAVQVVKMVPEGTTADDTTDSLTAGEQALVDDETFTREEILANRKIKPAAKALKNKKKTK